MIVTHVPLGLHSQWFSLSAVSQSAFFVHLEEKKKEQNPKQYYSCTLLSLTYTTISWLETEITTQDDYKLGLILTSGVAIREFLTE